MFRTALVLGASFVLISLVGCGDPLGPVDDFQLPEPDLSLGPARLTVGAFIATPCAFGIHGKRLVHLRDVPDATRYDLVLSLGYRRPTQDLDLAIIAAYGGRVPHRYVSIPWLGTILPDRTVPVLRDRYEVEHVESSGVACIF